MWVWLGWGLWVGVYRGWGDVGVAMVEPRLCGWGCGCGGGMWGEVGGGPWSHMWLQHAEPAQPGPIACSSHALPHMAAVQGWPSPIACGSLHSHLSPQPHVAALCQPAQPVPITHGSEPPFPKLGVPGPQPYGALT